MLRKGRASIAGDLIVVFGSVITFVIVLIVLVHVVDIEAHACVMLEMVLLFMVKSRPESFESPWSGVVLDV